MFIDGGNSIISFILAGFTLISQVVEAHPHSFLIGKFLQAPESESPPSCNEVLDLLIIPLLGFIQS